MKVIAVDDEIISLKSTCSKLREIPDIKEINSFSDPYQALDFATNHKIDVAFLDIEMFGFSGIELAKKFKDIMPRINIIFVTGYANYAVDAMALHASGYILKPVTTQALVAEINNLRNPISEAPSHIHVQTFGNFSVLVDGVPLNFKRSKSKEAFAYLIDRMGAGVSISELAGILWEDKEYDRSLQSQVQTVVSEMMKALKGAGISNIVIKRRNDISVLPDKIDCDYYKFLNGNVNAINSYHGEYMSNYSWAEFTNAFIDSKI